MANTILLRQGTTTPSSGSFSVGEPAWDKTAGKLYIKNAAGTMVEITGSGGVTALNGLAGAVQLAAGPN